MIWVLVLIIANSSGKAIDHIGPYQTKASCEAAQRIAQRSYGYNVPMGFGKSQFQSSVGAFCLPVNKGATL